MRACLFKIKLIIIHIIIIMHSVGKCIFRKDCRVFEWIYLAVAWLVIEYNVARGVVCSLISVKFWCSFPFKFSIVLVFGEGILRLIVFICWDISFRDRWICGLILIDLFDKKRWFYRLSIAILFLLMEWLLMFCFFMDIYLVWWILCKSVCLLSCRLLLSWKFTFHWFIFDLLHSLLEIVQFFKNKILKFFIIALCVCRYVWFPLLIWVFVMKAFLMVNWLIRVMLSWSMKWELRINFIHDGSW
jgi:hypothetical protein